MNANSNPRIANGQSAHHAHHQHHHHRSQTSQHHLGAHPANATGPHQRHHTTNSQQQQQQQQQQPGGARRPATIAPSTNRPTQQHQQQQQQPQPQPRLHHPQQLAQRTQNQATNRTSHPPQPAQRNSQSQPQQQPTPPQQQQQQQPPLPNVLPKGWKREEVVRTNGISSGLIDVVYSPQANGELTKPDMIGKKYRSKLELQRLIGHKYDMSLLDFKTGKISQVIWRKQRRLKQIAANPSNYTQVAKYDVYLNLPIRQTASVFKQPVFCVNNNHKNEPAPAANPPPSGQNGATANKTNEKPKPCQLFWELRLNNLKAVDVRYSDLDHDKQNEIEFENIQKFKNFDITNETIYRSVAASWYLSQNKALIGQEKEFSKNARIFVDREQPLIPQTMIKEEEVKTQESKVKELRRKLKEALDELDEVESAKKARKEEEEVTVEAENGVATKNEGEEETPRLEIEEDKKDLANTNQKSETEENQDEVLIV